MTMVNPYGYTPGNITGDEISADEVSEAESWMDEEIDDEDSENAEHDLSESASTVNDSDGESVPEDDEAEEYNEFRGQLNYAMDSLHRDGSFFWSACNDNAPNPGLVVDGLGMIGLPLSKRDASVLLEAGGRAYMDKLRMKSATKLNEILHELSADKVQTTNPAWDKYVDEMTKQAHGALGVAGEWQNVSARLDKLQIYKTWSSKTYPQTRLATERVPGMFGTLSFTLPSKHDRGNVRLTHLGRSVDMRTAEHSDFSTTAAAWYDDIECQMTDISSGNKVVLVYKLDQIGLPSVPTAPTCDWIEQIRNYLRAYDRAIENNEEGYQNFLIHKLEHSHDQRLALECLTGKDQRQLQVLDQLCTELGFGIYLATIRTVKEENDEDDEDEAVVDYIDAFTTLDGKPSALKPRFIENTNYLDPDYGIESEEPISTEYENRDPYYHDDEDNTVIYTYKHHAVVLVPSSCKVSFVLSSQNKLNAAFAIFDDFKEKAATGGSLAVADLHILCSGLLPIPQAEWTSGMYQNAEENKRIELGQKVAAATLEHNWSDLYDKLPLDYRLNLENIHVIGAQVARRGVGPWQSTLQSLLDARSTTQDRWSIICEIWAGYEQACPTKDKADMQQWLDLAISQLFRADCKPTLADALSLSKIVQREWALGAHVNRKLIKDFIEKAPAPALIEFVLQLEGSVTCFSMSTREKWDYLDEALRKLWANFTYYSERKSRSSTELRFYGAINQAAENVLRDLVSCKNLKAIIEISSDRHSAGRVEIVQTLTSQLPTVEAAYAEMTLIPFVCAVVHDKIPAFIDKDNPQLASAVTTYVTQILITYISKCVGPEPLKKTDRKRPQRGCSNPYCTDCKYVAKFMADPKQRELLYAVGEHRRKHLDSHFMDVKDAQYKVNTIRVQAKPGGAFSWKCVKHNERSNKQHREWQTNHKRAQETIKNIANQDFTRRYLGESFGAIMSCRFEALAEHDKSRLPLQQTATNLLAGAKQTGKRSMDDTENIAVGSVKRSKLNEPEVVDLTDA